MMTTKHHDSTATLANGRTYPFQVLKELSVVSLATAKGDHLGFPTGLGPRVEDILTTAIPGFYMSPCEDLALKRQ